MRFAYKLAAKLGQRDVRAMLAGMSATDLQEWRVWDSLDPFGEERSDFRHAHLMHLLYKAWFKDGGLKLKDFMPDFLNALGGREDPAQTVEEAIAIAKEIADAFAPKPEPEQ